MPSPIGHSLAGFTTACLLGATDPLSLGAAVLAANLADIDYPLRQRHGGPTHSLGAALLCGAGTGLLLLLVGHPLVPGFLLGALSYATHVLLDYLGKTPEDAEGGIPVFWPFTHRRFASRYHIFRTIVARKGAGSILPRLLNRSNAKAVLRELLLIGPVAVAGCVLSMLWR